MISKLFYKIYFEIRKATILQAFRFNLVTAKQTNEFAGNLF